MHLEESFVKEMQKKIYQSMYHSYLYKYIQIPNIDVDKLYLLLSVLKAKNLPIEIMESIAKTVMFIQVALDSHDLVKNDMEYEKSNITTLKEQQLTVLAGDYYSGLYYKTLSHLPEIPLIKQLALAIKIINEQKIRVYKVEIKSFDDYMMSMQQIETVLYQKLVSYYQLSDYEIISTNWLHTNHILKNKEKYIGYLIENNLIEISNEDPKLFAENKLNQYIQKLNEQLPKYIENETVYNKFIKTSFVKNFEPPIVR